MYGQKERMVHKSATGYDGRPGWRRRQEDVTLPDISTVFFDMDGTLLDLHFDNFFWNELLPRRHADKNGLSFEESLELVEKHSRATAGTLKWYCLDYWDEFLGMELVVLKEEILHLLRFRPHVCEVLDALRITPLVTAITTNAHPVTLQFKERHLGVSSYVDFAVSSHTLGFPKEDPCFWEVLQQKYAFDPDSTLFIDDNMQVLESARQYGIRHVMAIARPDTMLPSRHIETFPVLHDFRELLQITGTGTHTHDSQAG